MNSNELSELVARAEAVGKQDFHLGRLLIDMLLHIGQAHGLAAQTEEASAPVPAPTEQIIPEQPVSAPAQEVPNGN